MAYVKFWDRLLKIAQGTRGDGDATMGAVDHHLMENPEKMAAFAILELIRRFDKFIEAMGERDDDGSTREAAAADRPSRVERIEQALAGSKIKRNTPKPKRKSKPKLPAGKRDGRRKT